MYKYLGWNFVLKFYKYFLDNQEKEIKEKCLWNPVNMLIMSQALHYLA